jgi:hypothetical protein
VINPSDLSMHFIPWPRRVACNDPASPVHSTAPVSFVADQPKHPPADAATRKRRNHLMQPATD